MIPPASPIAEASEPNAPGCDGISRRAMIVYPIVGEAMLEAFFEVP
jgi:hypothetical protein